MFLPILFRYLPDAYQLLSHPKLCTLSWHYTACWSWLLHIPYFLDPSQWSLCMFPHQWLAEKGCYFQDGSSACSGMCHLQRIPWTAVVVTVPHSPAHLWPTSTYDLFRLFVKVRRCQNWHTQFSTKWMLCHEMCRSILHTTQTYCQAIIKSLDPWKSLQIHVGWYSGGYGSVRLMCKCLWWLFLPAPLPSPVNFLERVSCFLTQTCFWDSSDFHNVNRDVHNLYLLIILKCLCGDTGIMYGTQDQNVRCLYMLYFSGTIFSQDIQLNCWMFSVRCHREMDRMCSSAFRVARDL